MTVIVPYHFVPLSKWVHLPDWGHLISHDIPFEDGLCGSIKYTLTNQSPLLVGGHHKKNKDDSTTVEWAKDADGKPIIPGSSIKGMLRSVMEIATFSKMGVVEDKSLAYRDFKNDDYNRTLRSTKTKAGWIRYCKETQKWTYKTVEHSVVYDEDLNESSYCNNNRIDFAEDAVKKYDKYNVNDVIKFDKSSDPTNHDKDRTKAVKLGSGEIEGNLVFTDERVKANGNVKLRYNYIFHVNKNSTYTEISNLKAIKDFFEFHNPELINYLKNNPHKTYGIPIFLRISGNNIKAIGIAKLPKISYNYSVKQLIHKQQNLFNHQASYDMTEGVMGCVRDYGLSLKSRLSFTDAKIIKDNGFTKEINKVLMSPRESYLGGYIDGGNTTEIFRGYNNINNKIKGNKVYPRNKKFDDSNSNVAGSMISKMEFLEPNSEFVGEIFFHNLKPVELGALLWSLTYGDEKECYHGLGHAKPYGAGNVQIAIDEFEIYANNLSSETMTVSSYFKDFEYHMKEKHFAKEWKQSPQILHLLSFAKPSDANLCYMDLEKGWNSYNECNSRKEVLNKWKNLERKEDQNEISYSDTFKVGRLKDLLDTSTVFDRKLGEKEKEDENKLMQESIQDLPEYQQKIINLLAADQTVINNSVTPIRELLLEAISSNYEWQKPYYSELLKVVEKSNFLPNEQPNGKKPRLKYQKKKDLVDKLKQLINDG